MKNSLKAKNGFFLFAWKPTKLTSGETIWFKKFFVAGSAHGCQNRFAVSHRRFELKYSRESARIAGIV